MLHCRYWPVSLAALSEPGSFLAALEKPTAVLPPAMQEAIAEEMKAKQAHKHRGSQTADGANEVHLQAASRKSLETAGRKSLESGVQTHGGTPGVHTFGLKEAEDGIAHTDSGNLGEAFFYAGSSNWLQSVCVVRAVSSYVVHHNPGKGHHAGELSNRCCHCAAQQKGHDLPTCALPADKELAAVHAHNGGGQVSSGRLNVAGIVSHRASRKGGEAAVINKGMVLPFEPLSLTFRHMDYYVDMPAVRRLHPAVQTCTASNLSWLLPSDRCSSCRQGCRTCLFEFTHYCRPWTRPTPRRSGPSLRRWAA